MNKTTLTTIILDAAIILAVALFMFVIRPWDKTDKKDKANYTPGRELTIAEQEDAPKAADAQPAAAPAAKFCPNCGTPYEEDAKFCMKCGTPRQ